LVPATFSVPACYIQKELCTLELGLPGHHPGSVQFRGYEKLMKGCSRHVYDLGMSPGDMVSGLVSFNTGMATDSNLPALAFIAKPFLTIPTL